MKSFKEIKFAYVNNNLNNYLRDCSTLELIYFKDAMMLDDIVGYKVNILSAILNEIDYRNSNKIVRTRVK